MYNKTESTRKDYNNIAINTDPWNPNLLLKNTVNVEEYLKALKYINTIHKALNATVLKKYESNVNTFFSLPEIPNFLNIFSNANISCNDHISPLVSRTTSAESFIHTSPVKKKTHQKRKRKFAKSPDGVLVQSDDILSFNPSFLKNTNKSKSKLKKSLSDEKEQKRYNESGRPQTSPVICTTVTKSSHEIACVNLQNSSGDKRLQSDSSTVAPLMRSSRKEKVNMEEHIKDARSAHTQTEIARKRKQNSATIYNVKPEHGEFTSNHLIRTCSRISVNKQLEGKVRIKYSGNDRKAKMNVNVLKSMLRSKPPTMQLHHTNIHYENSSGEHLREGRKHVSLQSASSRCALVKLRNRSTSVISADRGTHSDCTDCEISSGVEFDEKNKNKETQDKYKKVTTEYFDNFLPIRQQTKNRSRFSSRDTREIARSRSTSKCSGSSDIKSDYEQSLITNSTYKNCRFNM